MRRTLCKVAAATGLLAASPTLASAQADAGGAPAAVPQARPAQSQEGGGAGRPAAPASRDRSTATGGNAGGKADKN